MLLVSGEVTFGPSLEHGCQWQWCVRDSAREATNINSNAHSNQRWGRSLSTDFVEEETEAQRTYATQIT